MPRTLPEACSHIIQCINDIEAFVAGVPPEQLMQDRLRRRAIERCLQIITEAVRGIPESDRVRYPSIPWTDVENMGNVLRHQYEDVNTDVILGTIQNDLGPLKAAVLEISPIYIADAGAKDS